MSFAIHVYEADNDTFVANLSASRQVRGVNCKDVLDGNGTGTVDVDWDHPDVAELTGDRIIRVYDNERCAFSFVIQKKREVTVPASGNDADKIVSVSGDGVRGILKRGRVLPWLPVASEGVGDQRPITRRRLFNAVAPTVDTSDGWITPYHQDRFTSEPGRPRGWPSNDAEWLWGEEEDETMTIGRCWFMRDFTIDQDETLVFLVTADDQFVDFLEGAELQREEPVFPAQVWYDPWRSPMSLKAGTYRYGVAAKNDGGKGAVMAECWRVSTAGLTTRVFMTGLPVGGGDPYDPQRGTWLCLPYPEHGDAGFGHTVGRIVGQLLGECHLRGELLDVSLGFDDDEDSNGDPWDVIPEFDFDATGTFGDAIDKLAETYVDVRIGYDNGLVLDLFQKSARGTIQPITLTAGDIASDAVETNYDIGNDVLVVRDRGMYLADSDLSVLAYGRRPAGVIQVGELEDDTVFEEIAGAYLEGLTTPGESRVIEVVPMLSLPAEPGDYIGVGEDLLRISEIGYQADFDALRKVPALLTPYDEARKRSERVVEKMIAMNGKTLASSRALDTGTNIPSGRLDPIKLTSWSWTLPEDLETEFWDTDELEPVGWQAYPLEEPARLWALIVECDWAEPDGSGGIVQVSEGQSRFSLQIDGGPAPVPLIATVPETSGTSDPHTYGIQYIFGPALVRAGQRLSVAPIENGAHINGSVTIWATEPL